MMNRKKQRSPPDWARAVAQYLEWFRSSGCFVFHDVPATGAWVLEPKALSKFIENEPDRLSRDEFKAIGSAVTSHIRAELGKTD